MKGGDDVLTSNMESEAVVFTDLIQQTPGRALEFWQGDPISFKEKDSGRKPMPQGLRAAQVQSQELTVQHCRSQPDTQLRW